MASSKDFRESLTKGSDEIQEMFCEPCNMHDKIDVLAVGFCVNCEEYMCDTCLRYDRRQTRDHRHLEQNDMPPDFCLEKCSIHVDNIIKYICVTCNKLICNVCKGNDHKNCKTVLHLPTYLKDIESNTAFSQLMGSISSLQKKIKETKQKVGKKIQKISRQQGEVTSAVNSYSDKTKKDLDSHSKAICDEYEKEKEEIIQRTKLKIKRLEERKLERIAQNNEQQKVLTEAGDDILKQVLANKNTEEKRLQACLKKNKALATEIDSLKIDLEHKRKPGMRYKLYTAIQLALDHVLEWKSDLAVIEKKADVSEYTVEPIQTDVRTNTLGPVENIFFLKEIWRSSHKRTGTFEHEIHTESTSKLCCTSLCLLSEFELIVTDNESKCVLSSVTEPENGQDSLTFTSLLESTQAGPWQAAKARAKTIIVAFPSKGEVKAVKVTESTCGSTGSDSDTSGQITGTRAVGESCAGLAHCQDNLIISYTKPAKVQILDMTGKIKTSVKNDSEGNPLFKTPRYVTVSPDGETIYVSDSDKHTVTSMTFHGEVKAIYKDSQLTKPAQLVADRSGAVFVCGEDSNNIHQLSADLEKVKVLLDKSNGIEKPVGLAYCNRQDRLYVGMRKPPIIKVFRISPV